MPNVVSRVKDSNPTYAVTVSALLIIVLIIVGDIKATWSLSAFTVLLYYSITNLSALKLPKDKRFFPKWISILGLAGCLFLSFYVNLKSLLVGSLLLLIGLVWFLINSRIRFSR